jgi:hypothetical protein
MKKYLFTIVASRWNRESVDEFVIEPIMVTAETLDEATPKFLNHFREQLKEIPEVGVDYAFSVSHPVEDDMIGLRVSFAAIVAEKAEEERIREEVRKRLRQEETAKMQETKEREELARLQKKYAS